MKLNDIASLDEQYYFGVFGRRMDVEFTRGRGQYLYDDKGKKYVDFLAAIACTCLGHAHPGFNNALEAQLKRFINVSNYFYSENQALFAQALCRATGYDKVFFGNSGAEANEAAIKLARKFHHMNGDERVEIICAQNSFHGRTLATLAATGQERFHTPYLPLMEKFTYVLYNDCAALEKAVSGKTCAVMLECVQGEGGVIPATREFLQTAREATERVGALLIFDEVQTGMGRTGTFLCQTSYGVAGDITTLAKGLGNGVPVSAILARGKCAGCFTQGDHGSTFGGNALSCTAGLYVVNKIIEEDLPGRCAKTGQYFLSALSRLKRRKSVVDVRGLGLLVGLELDPAIDAHDAARALLGEAFVCCTAGRNTLRFLPCYYIENDDIDYLAAALDCVLADYEKTKR